MQEAGTIKIRVFEIKYLPTEIMLTLQVKVKKVQVTFKEILK